MEGLLLAISFLTVVPVRLASVRAGGLGRAAVWFPLVGLGVGGAVAATALAGRVVWGDRWIAASLALGVNLLLTGGLHSDGLMDTADAFFSHKDRERMLEIMRDSRAGALGVASGGVVLLAKFSILSYLIGPGSLRLFALIALSCALGRLGLVTAAAFFPSARESGLGASFAAEVRPWHALAATAIAGAVAIAIWRWNGAILLGVALAVTLAVGVYWRRRLGGLTGDIYGAVNELVELAVLLTAGYLMG